MIQTALLKDMCDMAFSEAKRDDPRDVCVCVCVYVGGGGGGYSAALGFLHSAPDSHGHVDMRTLHHGRPVRCRRTRVLHKGELQVYHRVWRVLGDALKIWAEDVRSCHQHLHRMLRAVTAGIVEIDC